MKQCLVALLVSSVLWVSNTSHAQSRFAKEEPLLRTSQGLIVPEHPTENLPQDIGWQQFPDSTIADGAVYTFVYQDGFNYPSVVGGRFDSIGHRYSGRIASTDWGLQPYFGPTFDDGAGYSLYQTSYGLFAAGSFTTSQGSQFNHIAMLNWSSWSPLGSGLDGSVLSLAKIGDSLYVGGNFTHAGNLEVNHIAIWNLRDSAWEAITDNGIVGVDGGVATLMTNELYSGDSTLYVGGGFTHAGSITANKVASFQHGRWTSFASGITDTNGVVEALLPSSGGSQLIVGGRFSEVDHKIRKSLAVWSIDSQQWIALPFDTNNGLGGTVTCLQYGSFGGGGDFIAGGTFDTSISKARHLIEYSAYMGWAYDNDEPDGNVYAISSPLPAFALVNSSSFYLGGDFHHVGGILSPYFAEYYYPSAVKTFANGSSMSITPNPCSRSAALNLDLQQPTTVKMTLYDETGQTIRAFSFPYLSAGKQSLGFQIPSFESQRVLLAMIETGAVRKMIKLLCQ